MKTDDLSQLIIELYDKISSWEHEVVKKSGLSPAQMHAIEIIGHHQKLRMKELAVKMGITTGTLTVMIDRLEQMKLVERLQHPTDGRSYVIGLTAQGDAYFQEHAQMHQLLTDDLTATFNDEEISILGQMLGRLLQQF